MFTSSELALVEAFVRDMRELGAARVKCGEIDVTFDMPIVQQLPALPANPSDDEIKKAEERLLYGSSD